MVRSVEHWMPRHRITVPEYYRMTELGLLAPEARVELVEGAIVDMPPMSSGHASVVTYLTRALVLAVGKGALVRAQLPLQLDEYSEPEPDLLLARPDQSDYRDAHPGAEDTLLIIEVGATTARYDREVKAPLYARHGIPELWLIDLQAGMVTLLREPEGGEYRRALTSASPGVTPLAALPGVSIDLASVLT